MIMTATTHNTYILFKTIHSMKRKTSVASGGVLFSETPVAVLLSFLSIPIITMILINTITTTTTTKHNNDNNNNDHTTNNNANNNVNMYDYSPSRPPGSRCGRPRPPPGCRRASASRSVFIISNRKISNRAYQILKANMLLICPYCLKFQIARV